MWQKLKSVSFDFTYFFQHFTALNIAEYSFLSVCQIAFVIGQTKPIYHLVTADFQSAD